MNNRVARALWIAIIAISIQPHQALPSWHTNCFNPTKVKLLSAPPVPHVTELSRVGQGVIKMLASRQALTEPASWFVPVFIIAAEAPIEHKLYFEDPRTGCLATIDLDRPLSNRRPLSFELVHESATECRKSGLLSMVDLVEINPCSAKLCERADNDLILFLGPTEFEGVTIQDQLFYGGEFEIDLNQKVMASQVGGG